MSFSGSPASDLILHQTEAIFQTTPQNITQHIRSIDEENELDDAATCKSS